MQIALSICVVQTDVTHSEDSTFPTKMNQPHFLECFLFRTSHKTKDTVGNLGNDSVQIILVLFNDKSFYADAV